MAKISNRNVRVDSITTYRSKPPNNPRAASKITDWVFDYSGAKPVVPGLDGGTHALKPTNSRGRSNG